jgi:endo-1,4-beta-xylanase
MGILIFSTVLIIALILGSIVLIFFRRYRKPGIWMLGTLISLIIMTAVYVYFPRHYKRNYLQKDHEWSGLTFRKYADSLHFYIGAIPAGTPLSDPRFSENFNSLTPENALKMGPLLKDFKVGEYDFRQADLLVNQALEKNLRVRGHTLVWGKQSDMFKSPDLSVWLEKYPENERGTLLKKTIENHIITVLDHFRGRIHVWDVVNEPMSVFNQGKLENNVFLKYLGENYIPESFKLAHSTDPDLKLFLNENLISYTDKTAEAFLGLVKKMKDNNIPIDGVGIQAHIGAKRDTSVADLRKFLEKITSMGLEVEITEMDARLRLFSGAHDPYEAQGEYYARILQTCLDIPLCRGLTFWGFSDNRSWEDSMSIFFPRPNEPYLFDADMNPKPAYYHVYKALKLEYETRKDRQ